MTEDHDHRLASELDREVSLTCLLVGERLRFGDRPETPREVDHAACFRSGAAARAAAAELRARGYRVTFSRRWFTSTLDFTHIGAVDHDSATAFTREIVAIVQRYRGRYDGWGAFLDADPEDPHSLPAAT